MMQKQDRKPKKKKPQIEWKIYDFPENAKGRITVQKNIREWFMDQCESFCFSPDRLLTFLLDNLIFCKRCNKEVIKMARIAKMYSQRPSEIEKTKKKRRSLK